MKRSVTVDVGTTPTELLMTKTALTAAPAGMAMCYYGPGIVETDDELFRRGRQCEVTTYFNILLWNRNLVTSIYDTMHNQGWWLSDRIKYAVSTDYYKPIVNTNNISEFLSGILIKYDDVVT